MKVLELDPQREIPQHRLSQGNEPSLFLDLFGGCIMIKNGKNTDNLNNETLRLFQAVETADNRVRIHEQYSYNCLHSGSSFIAQSSIGTDFWIAKSTSPLTVAKIDQFFDAHKIQPLVKIQQGSEPNSFFKYLGIERNSVLQNPYFENHQAPIKRRLYRISFITLGNATADENEDCLSQEQLLSHGIYIFDACYELFIWIGHQIVESKDPMYQMIKLALNTAIEYAEIVNQEENGRIDPKKILLTFQNQESAEFRTHFPTWKNLQLNPVEESKFDLLRNLMSAEDALKDMETKKWSLKDIRKFVESGVPLGVDPKRIEHYLENSDFEKLFGISVTDFEKLPAWKQLEKKKQHQLIPS